jgi:hypothetical protein
MMRDHARLEGCAANRAAKPNEVVNSTGSWSEAEEAPNNAQLSNALASGYRILISFELPLPNARALRRSQWALAKLQPCEAMFQE